MTFIPRPNTPTPNVVAIDPDLNRSGVAVWHNPSRTWLLTESVSIENILEVLSPLSKTETTVYVECGWMVKKSNFRNTANRGHSENIAMKVGQNHATGKLIIKLLEAAGYTVIKFKPLKKGIFKDEKGWTQHGRDYVKKQSGLTCRMNDDTRDAIFTVLYYR